MVSKVQVVIKQTFGWLLALIGLGYLGIAAITANAVEAGAILAYGIPTDLGRIGNDPIIIHATLFNRTTNPVTVFVPPAEGCTVPSTAGREIQPLASIAVDYPVRFAKKSPGSHETEIIIAGEQNFVPFNSPIPISYQIGNK